MILGTLPVIDAGSDNGDEDNKRWRCGTMVETKPSKAILIRLQADFAERVDQAAKELRMPRLEFIRESLRRNLRFFEQNERPALRKLRDQARPVLSALKDRAYK
jgi:predicted transcriptional regulator